METEINPAAKAKFHMQFAIAMLNCGRLEEANKSFEKAMGFLYSAENMIDEILLEN